MPKHILLHYLSVFDGSNPVDLRLGPEAVVRREHGEVLDSQDSRWIDVSRSVTHAEAVEAIGQPARNGSARIRGWDRRSSSWLSVLVLEVLSPFCQLTLSLRTKFLFTTVSLPTVWVAEMVLTKESGRQKAYSVQRRTHGAC